MAYHNRRDRMRLTRARTKAEYAAEELRDQQHAHISDTRVYVLEIPPGLDLINSNRRLHWTKRIALTRTLRNAACIVARKAEVPPLGRIHVTGIYHPTANRRVDPANFYPSFKACVDGLVDARVVEDDDSTRVLGPDMRLGEKRTQAQLVLEIREVLT